MEWEVVGSYTKSRVHWKREEDEDEDEDEEGRGRGDGLGVDREVGVCI